MDRGSIRDGLDRLNWATGLSSLNSAHGGQQSMWGGMDPALRRELNVIRKLVGLRYQTPVREWPLTFVESVNALFVVREWPDGTITAYTIPAPSTSR